MEQIDNWENKDVEMLCANCFFYVNFRCRRHAPTMNGFPGVYPTDWCGDHKLSKDTMKILYAQKIDNIQKSVHDINVTGK